MNELLQTIKEILYNLRFFFFSLGLTLFFIIFTMFIKNHFDVKKIEELCSTNNIKQDLSYTNKINKPVRTSTALTDTNWWQRLKFATDEGTSIKEKPITGNQSIIGFFKLVSIIKFKNINKAILEDLRHNVQVFIHEGDVIDGKIKIIKIGVKSVTVLENEREIEILLFNKKNQIKETVKTNTLVVNLQPQFVPITNNILERVLDRNNTNDLVLTAISSNDFGFKIQDNLYVIEISKVKDYYNKILKDPETLEVMANSFNLIKDDDKVQGFQIQDNLEKSIYKSIGLEDKDIIKKCNGLNLTNEKRVEYFVNKFISGKVGNMNIEIERNGIITNMYYRIKD